MNLNYRKQKLFLCFNYTVSSGCKQLMWIIVIIDKQKVTKQKLLD